MTSPEEIVRRGYDAAARRYAAGRGQLENERHLRLFTQPLPPPAAVLDIGCGSGRPVAAYLVERGYAVTGIDIWPTQIELARRRVPDAIVKGRTRRGGCPSG
jgi:SAM-dependent methyltransferase